MSWNDYTYTTKSGFVFTVTPHEDDEFGSPNVNIFNPEDNENFTISADELDAFAMEQRRRVKAALSDAVEEASRIMGYDPGSPDGDKTVAVIKCVCGALLNTDVGGKRVCPNCGVEVELTHEV